MLRRLHGQVQMFGLLGAAGGGTREDGAGADGGEADGNQEDS